MASGKPYSTDILVPPKDLVSLYDIAEKHNIGEGVKMPAIHKDIKSNVISILNDYPNIVFTDGLRSNNNEENAKGSAKGTLHKYGHALDVRLNKNKPGHEQGRLLLQQLQNNPALMKKYGIISVLAHGVGGNYHIHIEFKPNKL